MTRKIKSENIHPQQTITNTNNERRTNNRKHPRTNHQRKSCSNPSNPHTRRNSHLVHHRANEPHHTPNRAHSTNNNPMGNPQRRGNIQANATRNLCDIQHNSTTSRIRRHEARRHARASTHTSRRRNTAIHGEPSHKSMNKTIRRKLERLQACALLRVIPVKSTLYNIARYRWDLNPRATITPLTP